MPYHDTTIFHLAFCEQRLFWAEVRVVFQQLCDMMHTKEESVTSIPSILFKNKICRFIQSSLCLFCPLYIHTAKASSNCPAAFFSYFLRMRLNTSSVVLHSPIAICRSDSSMRALISSIVYGSNFLRDLEVTVFSSATNHINSSSDRELVMYSNRPFNATVLIFISFICLQKYNISLILHQKNENNSLFSSYSDIFYRYMCI